MKKMEGESYVIKGGLMIVSGQKELKDKTLEHNKDEENLELEEQGKFYRRTILHEGFFLGQNFTYTQYKLNNAN